MAKEHNLDEFTDTDEVKTKFHDFAENPEVIGTLVSIDKGTYGDQYALSTDKGEVTVGSATVLKTKIRPEFVGKRVKIVFLGEVANESGKRTYHDFAVYCKR